MTTDTANRDLWDPEWHLLRGLQFVPHLHLYLALANAIDYVTREDEFSIETLLDIIAQYGYTGEYHPTDFDREESDDMTKTAVAASDPDNPITEAEIEEFLHRMEYVIPGVAEDPMEGFDINKWEAKKRGSETAE